MRLTPLTPAIGAVVEGFDLSVPLTDGDVAAIRTALDDRLVLFFENQSLTPRQTARVCSELRPRSTRNPFYPGHPDAPEVMMLEHDATHRANSDRWHNDVTYLATPPMVVPSMYSQEIPGLGGDTLWANMYAAYEALSPSMQSFVDGLRAIHSFSKNFTPERFVALRMEERREKMYAEHPPVSHPVARLNPATGRRALYVNQDFTSQIEGLTARESDALLRFLFEHMAQPEVPNALALERTHRRVLGQSLDATTARSRITFRSGASYGARRS